MKSVAKVVYGTKKDWTLNFVAVVRGYQLKCENEGEREGEREREREWKRENRYIYIRDNNLCKKKEVHKKIKEKWQKIGKLKYSSVRIKEQWTEWKNYIAVASDWVSKYHTKALIFSLNSLSLRVRWLNLGLSTGVRAQHQPIRTNLRGISYHI